MFLSFNIKIPFFFFFLILCQSNEHLEDTFISKLLDQFIELHNTQFFKD